MACDTDGNHQAGLSEARRGRWRVTARELQDTREDGLLLLLSFIYSGGLMEILVYFTTHIYEQNI